MAKRMLGRLLHPLWAADTYRAFLFYAGQLALAVAGFVVIVAAWPVTVVFAITPLVVPLLIGLRYGIWLLAVGQAELSDRLLGQKLQPGYPPSGTGFWGRGSRVLKDGAFWKQQAHILVYFPVGLAML